MRSIHIHSQGLFMTVFGGRCPYLRDCLLLIWQDLQDFVSDLMVVRIPFQCIAAFIVSVRHVSPGRGSGPRVGAILFFFSGRPNFLKPSKLRKKPDRWWTKRGSFIDNSIITRLHGLYFLIDLQLPGLVRPKFGVCYAMLNHFQHGMTIAICCFFVTGFWHAVHKNSTIRNNTMTMTTTPLLVAMALSAAWNNNQRTKWAIKRGDGVEAMARATAMVTP